MCLFGSVHYFRAGNTVKDVPNSNAPGLVIGRGKERRTALFGDEKLGRRFGIGGGTHSRVHCGVVGWYR
jgi:hypothetical protein